jgi:predicted transcriptional regulator
MDLGKYIERANIQKKAFARMADISPSALSNYIYKRRKPRLDIAQKIIKASKGEVTIEDLLK